MKALLALALISMGAVAYGSTGTLKIDVDSNHLEFIEKDGHISTNGNSPFGRSTTQTVLEEKADGSIQGFMMGTPINLVCSDTACINNGSTDITIKITHKNNQTHYDGTIGYNFVHGVVCDSMISVTADGGFEAHKAKSGNYVGQGIFSKGKFGSFSIVVSPSGSLSLEDSRIFVLGLLSTFVAH